MDTTTLDTDFADFESTLFRGGQLEWLGEPHDNDFGFEPRMDVQGHGDFTLTDFWTDIIDRPPDGSVYFDGFIIFHNYLDMMAAVRELETRYARITEYLYVQLAKGGY